MTEAQPDWQSIAARKRAERDAKIPAAYLLPASQLPPLDASSVVSFPATCGLLTPLEVAITETDDIDVLLSKLASREYTAAQVLEAFIKRTSIAHQLVNPLTEVHFEDARRWAKELDDELEATGKPRGPLHGLPVSLKDQFRMKGSDATIAYVSYVGNKTDEDSVCAMLLKEAGAVPFVKTNLPQTIMYAETDNVLFGRTSNPHNRQLHPGGSSGGEGALIALKGSPLGVGTDVGGSVRIPAGMNGLFGLRPSSHRLPYEGAVNSLEGQETVPSVIGPLTRSLSGVVTFMKAILAGQPWLYDPLTPQMPWREEQFQQARSKKSLRIGVMKTDGLVHPFPPYLRALNETAARLSSAGHTLIPFTVPDPSEALSILTDAFCADGGKDVLTSIANTQEPLGPQVTGIGKPELSAYQLWQVNRRKNAYRKTMLDRWRTERLDAVLCPVSAYPALPHGEECWVMYTGLWNLVDYASISLPITKVDAALDPKADSFEGEAWYGEFDRHWQEKYDPVRCEGAPVGLQLVAGRYEEERVLGFAEVVCEALRR